MKIIRYLSQSMIKNKPSNLSFSQYKVSYRHIESKLQKKAKIHEEKE